MLITVLLSLFLFANRFITERLTRRTFARVCFWLFDAICTSYNNEEQKQKTESCTHKHYLPLPLVWEREEFIHKVNFIQFRGYFGIGSRLCFVSLCISTMRFRSACRIDFPSK